MKRIEPIQDFDLSGFRLCHVHGDMHSVLFEQRVIRGLTQREVADRAGISIQQYQKFERGARNIMTSSFTTACKVIEALELDITRFYHDEYVIGEEIYLIGNKLYYKKTDKPIDEDVLETDDENTETGSTEAGSTEAGSTEAGEPGITEE